MSNDPLHGKTLEMILVELEAEFGWTELGQMININCFNHDPSIKSSLTFLRKTPWARKKVESLYLDFVKTKKPWKSRFSGFFWLLLQTWSNNSLGYFGVEIVKPILVIRSSLWEAKKQKINTFYSKFLAVLRIQMKRWRSFWFEAV